MQIAIGLLSLLLVMAVASARAQTVHLTEPEFFQGLDLSRPELAAVLSLAEIRKMTAEMLLKNKDYLPRFKNVKL